jgi:tetratricopeptide (TPR) repeat protein
MRFSRHITIFLIVVLGLLVYSNTFNSPFQWDESSFIEKNPAVKDLTYFFEPSKAKGSEYYGALKSRYIGYLTFALNYKIHGLDVTGYHIFNITVHILNALLVYFLVMLTFKSPFLRNSLLRGHSRYIALFSAVLFISHPVQTEAVTYIFQRLASLMTFFYLLSLTAYIKARLSKGKPYLLYVLSFVSAVLAMKTKENAFTLPVVITLYEFLFFRSKTDSLKVRIFRLVPWLLTMLIVPLTILNVDRPVWEGIGGVGYKGISRWDYLFTQFRVIVTYIRLLFLPVNQNIDYDYPVYHSFFNPEVFLSFMFLLCIFATGVYLLYRSRKTPDLRVIAFGIFWFFITLSVESSIIPIPMIIAEYRIYLPSIGVFLATLSGMFLFTQRLSNKRMQVAVISLFLLLLVALSITAYLRNSVWESRISLWEDTVKKSPMKARVHDNLGASYWEKGLTTKAIEHLETAVRLDPGNARAHYNLGVYYGAVGNVRKEIEHYQLALNIKPDAEIYTNLGTAYTAVHQYEDAIHAFKKALRLKPRDPITYNNLGNVYYFLRNFQKAQENYERAKSIDPYYPDPRYNLIQVYIALGDYNGVVSELAELKKVSPEYAQKILRDKDYLEFMRLK